jgi:hypothetical protein
VFSLPDGGDTGRIFQSKRVWCSKPFDFCCLRYRQQSARAADFLSKMEKNPESGAEICVFLKSVLL